jgi:hypothetical protein
VAAKTDLAPLEAALERQGFAPDPKVAGWRYCRIPSFIELAKRIAKHRAQIEATLLHGLSNGLVGSVNPHPAPHPAGLRLPRSHRVDRAGDAQARWLLPHRFPAVHDPRMHQESQIWGTCKHDS